MSTRNAQVILTVDTTTKVIIGKTSRKEILETQLIADSNKLKSLPMQGQLYNIDGADYLLSQNIYRNFRLSGNLVQFRYRARYNVLPVIIRYHFGTQIKTNIFVRWMPSRKHVPCVEQMQKV